MELIIVIVFLVGVGVWGYMSEKARWNGGRCKECLDAGVRDLDTLWYYFDTDSQGGRGYHCPQDHTIWISYSVDKKGITP